MKHKRLWDFLLGTVLGAVLGTAAIGCLVSAFGFSVSLWAVGVFCLLAALLRSVPKGQYVAGALFVLAAVWLLVDGVLIDSAEGLLFRLTEIYDKGYGWGVVRWSDRTPEELDKALPVVLYLVGSLIALCTAGAVQGKSGLFPVLLTLLTVGACFVVTDKVPAAAWVFAVLFAGAVLLLSSLLRKQNGEQATRLTAMLIVPVFLCVLLLFAFVPQKGYDGAARAERWADQIVALWDRLMGRYPELSGADTVDLSDVGRQSYFHSEVMEVISPVDGTLYLRGRALDTYDGRSWTNSGTDLTLPWPQESELERIGEVEITTQYVHRLLYLPYYTQSLDMTQYPTGKTNDHKLKKYSVSCARLSDESLLQAYYPDPNNQIHVLGINVDAFTSLPDSTRRWARQKVEEITGGKRSWYHIAKDIEAYVESAAVYDLKTDRMPLGQKDFARWFLEDSDTGYCVHYATAAAVLLRAAGIPARYVTGYMVEGKSKEAVTVTDADAHAWVEYWLPPFGWVVLEATPASIEPWVDTVDTRPATIPTTRVDIEKDETVAPEKETSREVPAVLWWLLGAAVLTALAVIQRRLRLACRVRRLERGTPNERALTRWRYLARCHKALKTEPDEMCLELAEKAKFSQYTITAEELGALDLALGEAKKRLRKKNVFLRLYWSVILALI